MTIRATDDPIARYYELHPDEWEEDNDVSNATAHTRLMLYLTSVLTYYYKKQDWFIIPELVMQHINWPLEKPVTPDLAVFLGTIVPLEVNMSSWVIGRPDRPAPDVVFEIASESTWDEDISRKPHSYALLGAAEYYTYDPYTPQVWKPADRRLRGWHNAGGHMFEVLPNPDGSIWSPKLRSYLMPDDKLLRLLDIDRVRRVSEWEAAEAAVREAQQAKRQARIAAKRLREAEESELQAILRANSESVARAEAERLVTESEAARAEAERKAEARAAKLRELGIDPDDL